jgi:hypothetical protein
MTTITIINSNEWIYLILFLFGFYLMIVYSKPFSANNLIDSFIYLVNKTVILLLTISFLFAFMFEYVGQSDKVITYFKEVFKILIYYIILNYSVFYGLKLIEWMKNFYKYNDLLNIKYFEKIEKENNKK